MKENPLPENTGAIQAGRWPRGTSGNPAGKPKGARHKATLAAETLLDGEAEALTRKAVELAKRGDTTALRLCLDRILPVRKDSYITIELPVMKTAADIVLVQSTILQAVGAGGITPAEGTSISAIAEGVRKAIETEEIERRIVVLESCQITSRRP